MADPNAAGPPGRGPILVVGDVLADVVAVPAGSPRPGTDVAARVTITGGGSAANAAAWIAHQLCPVALCAAVGEDAVGAQVRTELVDAGVDVVGPVVAGVATGVCVVLVAPDGERTMLPDRGANEHLGAADVEAVVDGDWSWVHLSGYALLHPGSRAAGQAALDGARARGVATSVDVASAGPLADIGPATFLDMVGPIDVAFANEAELAVLGGEAEVLCRAGAVVVKRGRAGATWTDGVDRVDVSAAPGPVVDTTGAGDALGAGFLARTHMGASPAEALRAGVALAAKAVASVGARP